ncbi:MAG: hypothetical protein ABI601_15590 [bacterium]
MDDFKGTVSNEDQANRAHAVSIGFQFRHFMGMRRAASRDVAGPPDGPR